MKLSFDDCFKKMKFMRFFTKIRKNSLDKEKQKKSCGSEKKQYRWECKDLSIEIFYLFFVHVYSKMNTFINFHVVLYA